MFRNNLQQALVAHHFICRIAGGANLSGPKMLKRSCRSEYSTAVGLKTVTTISSLDYNPHVQTIHTCTDLKKESAASFANSQTRQFELHTAGVRRNEHWV